MCSSIHMYKDILKNSVVLELFSYEWLCCSNIYYICSFTLPVNFQLTSIAVDTLLLMDGRYITQPKINGLCVWQKNLKRNMNGLKLFWKNENGGKVRIWIERCNTLWRFKFKKKAENGSHEEKLWESRWCLTFTYFN